MTDVDELREALQGRPVEPLAELDIAQIMKDGGRLRRRRRVRTGVASAAVLFALVGGMALSQVSGRAEVRPALVTVSPTATPVRTATSGPAPTADPTSTPTPPPTPTRSQAGITSPTKTVAASATPSISPSPVTPTGPVGPTATSGRPSNESSSTVAPSHSPTFSATKTPAP